MPTENEKNRQKQNRGSSNDPKQGGMGQGSGKQSSPEREWQQGNDQSSPSSPSSQQPWRDRQEGDSDIKK